MSSSCVLHGFCSLGGSEASVPLGAVGSLRLSRQFRQHRQDLRPTMQVSEVATTLWLTVLRVSGRLGLRHARENASWPGGFTSCWDQFAGAREGRTRKEKKPTRRVARALSLDYLGVWAAQATNTAEPPRCIPNPEGGRGRHAF